MTTATNKYPTLPDVIGRKLVELDGQIEKVRAMSRHAQIIEQARKHFAEIDYHSDLDYDLRPTWAVQINDADWITKIAVWLRGRNYQISSFKDFPEYQFRQYKYQPLDATWERGTAILLTVHFKAESDDARCRYVKVGTEDVAAVPAKPATTKDVYELQCDDGPVIDTLQPVEAVGS